MARALWTNRAVDDLVDIWRYIAQDNSIVADRLYEKIEAKSLVLAEHPGLGAARPDIAPETHFSVVGKYLLLYRIIPDGIEVQRVIHGARDIYSLFDDD